MASESLQRTRSMAHCVTPARAGFVIEKHRNAYAGKAVTILPPHDILTSQKHQGKGQHQFNLERRSFLEPDTQVSKLDFVVTITPYRRQRTASQFLDKTQVAPSRLIPGSHDSSRQPSQRSTSLFATTTTKSGTRRRKSLITIWKHPSVALNTGETVQLKSCGSDS